MHKIMFFFVIFPGISYALYNPFFVEDKPKAPVQVQVIKKEITKKKPIKARQNVSISYFGFVSSAIGEFALIDFNGRIIVVTKDDKLYSNDSIFKVKEIASNYMLVNDKYGRVQTVYFSSERER